MMSVSSHDPYFLWPNTLKDMVHHEATSQPPPIHKGSQRIPKSAGQVAKREASQASMDSRMESKRPHNRRGIPCARMRSLRTGTSPFFMGKSTRNGHCQ